ncbi:serine/threonine-protein kinase TBK1-like [Saccoglossus kowalevskii]
MVAVKTFNHVSFMRPYEVQMREFEVLLKLNHENIVKMFDIEEEQSSRQKVIVMELCEGSLYTMLDEPQNAYGLTEMEFKSVLKDVAAGMNHLREKNVVHRDLKPGNIMKVKREDGRSTYKLADFGAARELGDSEQFMSLYGTEEYLHPDLYERAVLRKPMGKIFNATVDLWSIGVTLFHVAAGHLPFRPYGGRKNRETMFFITTEKASGVISGIQKDDGGEIIWSRELPKTTQLSQGLSNVVTPLLAGLMECDESLTWSFDKFFSETQKILSMEVIDVLNVSTARLHRIYVEPDATYAVFQDLIAAQTDISSGHQELFYDYECFCPDALAQCFTYPRTTEENAMILFRKDVVEFPAAIAPIIPKLPKMSNTYNLDNDAMQAKMSAAVMYSILRVLMQVICIQNLIKKAKKIFQFTLVQELKELRIFQKDFESKFQNTNSEIEKMRDQVTAKVPHMVVAIIGKDGNETGMQLKELQDEVISLQHNAAELSHKCNHVCQSLDDIYQDIVKKDALGSIWNEKCGCDLNEKCEAKQEVLVEKVAGTAVQSRNDKALKRLSYNDEQIHKFEKQKMYTYCVKGNSLYQDHCEPNLRLVHRQLSTWFKTAVTYRREMTKIDGEMSHLYDQHQLFAVKVVEFKTTFMEKMKIINVAIENLLKSSLEKSSYNEGTNAGHHTTLPPKHKVLIPKDLKEEIKIFKKEMKSMNDKLKENNTVMHAYKNSVDELQKGDDKDFNFENGDLEKLE